MVDMSDTPAGMISRLDDALRRRGSLLILKRGDLEAPSVSANVKAVEKELDPKSLVGDTRQGDSRLILSPTGLGAFGAPKRGDWAHFLGRDRSIYFVRPLPISDVVVRYELLVRG